MKLSYLFILIVSVFLVIPGVILPGTATEVSNTRYSGDLTTLPDSESIQSENGTGINSLSGENTLLNDTLAISFKVPKSDLIFAEEMNTSHSRGSANKSILSGNETISVDGFENLTETPTEYKSLGDIIKAKDWKALGEYNCKVKAENADKFNNSGLLSEDPESKWNSYFTSPQTIVYTPCCG